MSVIADLPGLNLWLALARPPIRTEGGYSLQTASLVIHELSFGIQRLAEGRRKERFRSYLQNLLSSGLPLLVTRNISVFVAFDGLQLSTGSLSHATPITPAAAQPGKSMFSITVEAAWIPSVDPLS